MAEDLTTREPAPPPAEPAAELPPAEPEEPIAQAPAGRRARERRLFRTRFAIAYLALAAVAGAGVGAAALLYNRTPEETAAWSPWKPVGGDTSFDKQIADYVAARYRLPSGKTLVGVISAPPQLETSEGVLPIQAVAIEKEGNDSGTEDDDVDVVRTENSVMYTLCGLGARCSIREGQPSAARMRLLRREALELALYSFKYMDGLDSVITLMPTNIGDADDPNDDTATALFFEKADDDVERALDRPLEETLLSPTPPQAAEISAVEGLMIDRLTESRLFRYQFTQAQAGGAVMYLVPVDAT